MILKGSRRFLAWLCLLLCLLCWLDQVVSQEALEDDDATSSSSSTSSELDYDAIAANFGSTPTEILSLGGRMDDQCVFQFNATVDNCQALTSTLTLSPAALERCDCFSFCQGQLVGCYAAGENPPQFTCELSQVVTGCPRNMTEMEASSVLGGNNVAAAENPCPPGYMCSRETEKSCDEIRQIPIDLGLGDVHAGVYCPGREDRRHHGYQNCENGFYCPNSTTKIPCPKGFFCPHKTAIPEIKCRHCDEGAKTLEREPYGYIIFIVLAGLLVAYVIYLGVRRYDWGLYQTLMELQARAGTANYASQGYTEKQRQEKLKYLLPKLLAIESRVLLEQEKLQAAKEQQQQEQQLLLQEISDKSDTIRSLEKDQSARSNKDEKSNKKPNKSFIQRTIGRTKSGEAFQRVMKRTRSKDFDDPSSLQEKSSGKPRKPVKILKIKEDKIVFDVRKLFDLLDTNDVGELTHEQIQSALALNSSAQVREFFQRMNVLGRLPPDTDKIPRAVFIKYFLLVLEQISHLEPTEDEANRLFDVILKHPANFKTSEQDAVTYESFFDPPLSDFLPEPKINALIKGFRTLQERQSVLKDELFFDMPDSPVAAGTENPITAEIGHRSDGNVFRHMKFRTLQERQSVLKDELCFDMPDSPVVAGTENPMTTEIGHRSDGNVFRRMKSLLSGLSSRELVRESVSPRRGSLPAMASSSDKPTDGEPGSKRSNSDPVSNNPRASAFKALGGSDTAINRRQSAFLGVRRSSVSEEELNPAVPAARHMRRYARPSLITPFTAKYSTIARREFVRWYPKMLMEVEKEEEKALSERQLLLERPECRNGVDIAFEDLSLSVKVKNNTVKIVNGVTGRLQAGSMTALMGGSGAGKTSLLNALCGRAFYGEVTGIVKVNGHKTSIEEHASAVGFVPQDDIVYAELTVRENFIFSGKFQLPSGTPLEEIKDLADTTMANLGLSRVMHSMVGDVTRRGVSGGEKKRVNIGLEIMGRKDIIFLDEPTSGLDSNSAMLVMESLKTLVKKEGTTICSVIHQPRKFIYELFDSLILLGVGGNMVYHGPTSYAKGYFENLGYVLPPGESISDWLIDISSGNLEPTGLSLAQSRTTEKNDAGRKEKANVVITPGLKSSGEKGLPSEEAEQSMEFHQLVHAGTRVPSQDDDASEASEVSDSLQETESTEVEGAEPALENAATRAAARRQILYDKWNDYFSSLSKEQKQMYTSPEAYNLPKKIVKASFGKQLLFQIRRLLIVSRRNWMSKFIDMAIIIVAVAFISLLDGTAEPTSEKKFDNLQYESIAEPSSVRELVEQFPFLFEYAIHANTLLQAHSLKVGVLVSVLVGLAATKIITSKRKEFFREAGSGYNVNAYFLAVNIVATVEHSIVVLIAALFSMWLRNSLAAWHSFFVSYLMLGWITVSWGLLFPLLVPLDNVVLVTGFYMVLFSLLFSGGIPPITYENIYSSTSTAIFSGLFSPARYFVESFAVSESRCLPVQSGFTDFGPNFRGEALQAASFNILHLGQKDIGEITQRSYIGWHWATLPSLVVGLWIRWLAVGAVHVSGRSQQAKKPLLHVLKKSGTTAASVILYFLVLIGLLALAIYLILKQRSTIE